MPAPRWEQLAASLRQEIAAGRWRTGELIPTELELSRRHSLARGTVRQALLRLVAEGLLERRAGSGTRVRPPLIGSALSAWESFSGEMERRGTPLADRLGRFVALAPPAACVTALGLPDGGPRPCLERVRGGPDPVVWFRSWFHPRAGLAADADPSRPLYAQLQVVPSRSQETLGAVAADATAARRLGIRTGTALLRRVRLVLDAGGRPLEWNIGLYRGDRFELQIELHRGAAP